MSMMLSRVQAGDDYDAQTVDLCKEVMTGITAKGHSMLNDSDGVKTLMSKWTEYILAYLPQNEDGEVKSVEIQFELRQMLKNAKTGSHLFGTGRKLINEEKSLFTGYLKKLDEAEITRMEKKKAGVAVLETRDDIMACIDRNTRGLAAYMAQLVGRTGESPIPATPRICSPEPFERAALKKMHAEMLKQINKEEKARHLPSAID